MLLLACDSIRALVRCWRITDTIAAALIFAATSATRAHEFGDDAGDTAASAVSLDGSQGGRFTLEVDTDEDWFSFTALPETTYTVNVSRVGIYDGASVLQDRYGTGLDSNNSLPAASSFAVSCSNGGPVVRCYVSVRGHLDFTTGTYDIAVSRGFEDSDSDGMPDPWERRHFDGALAHTASGDKDGDGGDNISEYYWATDPTNPASCLRITDLVPSPDGVTVKWQAVPSAWYRILDATNLNAATDWRVLSTNKENGPVSREYLDTSPPAPTSRFYRVEFVY